MLRRAFSMALLTAAGTSRALSRPMPMRPAPSPTTVNAEKPKIRPPLTTLATRLTLISFSCKLSLRFSDSLKAATISSSEFQTVFTRCVGQCLHAPMVLEAGAVKRDTRDARTLGFFSNTLADQFCRLDVAAVLDLSAHVRLKRGGGGQHFAACF